MKGNSNENPDSHCRIPVLHISMHLLGIGSRKGKKRPATEAHHGRDQIRRTTLSQNAARRVVHAPLLSARVESLGSAARDRLLLRRRLEERLAHAVHAA